MQKVKYGVKKKYRFLDIIKFKLSKDENLIRKADCATLEQLLTKDESWGMEDEWRIAMYVDGNDEGKRLYTDIVSGVYLDFSVMEEENAKRIIELAKTNGWEIRVRWFSGYEEDYRYITLDCYYAIRKEMEKYQNISNL